MGGRNGGALVPAGMASDCAGKIGAAGEIQAIPKAAGNAGSGLAAVVQPQSVCAQQ